MVFACSHGELLSQTREEFFEGELCNIALRSWPHTQKLLWSGRVLGSVCEHCFWGKGAGQTNTPYIWVLHAELIAELLRLSKSSFHFLLWSSFNFVVCDVDYFFVAQSHSVDVSRWSALIISSHSRSRIIFLYFSASKAHLPLSFTVFIHVLLIWLLLSVKFSVSASTSLRIR